MRLKSLQIKIVGCLGCILFFFASGYARSSAIEQKPWQDRRFISDPLEITPTAMLDAEKWIEQAKQAEDLSDSLWMFIEMMADSQQVVAEDSLLINQFLRQGLDILSTDLNWLPEVRRIERHIHQLKFADYRLVLDALTQRAIDAYFEAKRIHPYNPWVKVSLFQNILSNQLIRRNFSEEALRRFEEKCRQTRWLKSEMNGFYNILGTLYEQFNEWTRAFAYYDSAYQIVSQPIYPPGIDSTFAFRMDSVAGKAFIANERRAMGQMVEKEALELKVLHDSLLAYYGLFADSLNHDYLTVADSQAARQFIDQALDHIQPSPNRMTQKRLRQVKQNKYYLGLADIQFVTQQIFNNIEAKMLTAKQIDPFRKNLRLNLGKDIYYKTAQAMYDSALYHKSVAELENLIWIEKGIWVYYFYLGDAYMGIKNWEKAFENYQQSEEVFIKTAIFAHPDQEEYITKLDSVPVDSNLLALIVFRQATAKTRLYEGKEALKLLRYAFSVSQDDFQKQEIQKNIDAINWDDGNVHAMNLRRRAYEYSVKGNFAKAKGVLLRLLDILWTKRTKDEINHQIAMIDFQQLDRKEDGIERLRLVVSNMTKDADDAPVDPVNEKYFKDYGTMCYHFGNRYLLQDDRKMAYIYFVQATQLKWFGRPKSYFQLAGLSEFDPVETIQLCYQALDEAENLTPGEKRQVAELLSNAYQKQAKFREARQWHQKSLDKDWCANKISS